MRVAFRVDASVQTGSGHVMRCLTLADQLQAQGAEVLFVCRELTGNLNALIAERGFRLCRLPVPQKTARALDWNRHAAWLEVDWVQDADETLACLGDLESPADWLVIDHYALDRSWQERLRPFIGRIMVIDDLADRPHDCDLLLDQNLYADQEVRYSGLVPPGCEQLLGPKFALLRPGFAAAREALSQRTGDVRRILVFMGGSDPGNVTGKVLDALAGLKRDDLSIDLVIGAQSCHRTLLKERCEALSWIAWHENVADIAALMMSADLAVGGGGTTTWERCALCLPAMIISIAENQSPIAKAVSAEGAAVYLGEQRNIDVQRLGKELGRLLDNPDLLKRMGERAGRLVDAMGVHRVVRQITGMS